MITKHEGEPVAVDVAEQRRLSDVLRIAQYQSDQYGEDMIRAAGLLDRLAERLAVVEAALERSGAAQANLVAMAERDRAARKRSEEAFDLISPWVAKFANAAKFYDGGRPRYAGSTVMLHDSDPDYSRALTSTATGIGGPGAPESPTLGDLRMLANAYDAARAALNPEHPNHG